jgi:hypothetical protein
MFEGLNYLTLYWLSGFAEARFEIWDSKKISIQRAEDSLSFSVYLAWPQEVADDARITIRCTEGGLVFSTDWFPEEEFVLKPFESPVDGGIILMSNFQREAFFIHLRERYE